METFSESIQELVLGLDALTAGIGLYVIAFFDSSLLSLPEINDVLLVYFGAHFPAKAYYYALMTVLGSASGCSLLYWLARGNGYAFLKRRYPEGKLQGVFKLVERYGVLTVLVPAVLPPPFPFKIFVLSSGILGLTYSRFLVAVMLGRTIRYFGEAYLAVRFGEQAIAFLEANSSNVLTAVIGGIVIGFVVHVAIRRRRRASRRAHGSEGSEDPEPIRPHPVG